MGGWFPTGNYTVKYFFVTIYPLEVWLRFLLKGLSNSARPFTDPWSYYSIVTASPSLLLLSPLNHLFQSQVIPSWSPRSRPLLLIESQLYPQTLFVPHTFSSCLFLPRATGTGGGRKEEFFFFFLSRSIEACFLSFLPALERFSLCLMLFLLIFPDSIYLNNFLMFTNTVV